MHPDQIDRYKKARPFQPFRLLLDDGESLDVRNPQDMLVTPVMLFVGVGETPSGLPVDFRFVAPERVVRIDVLPLLGQAS